MPRQHSAYYLRKRRGLKPIGFFKRKVRGKKQKVTVPIMPRVGRRVRRGFAPKPKIKIPQAPKRPQAKVRYTTDGKYVLVLCDKGHLIESHRLDRDFAGSAFESELSFRHYGDRFDRLAWKCKGAGHELETKKEKPKLSRDVMVDRTLEIARTHLDPMSLQNLQNGLNRSSTSDQEVEGLYQYWTKKGKKEKPPPKVEPRIAEPKTLKTAEVEGEAYRVARERTEKAMAKGKTKAEVLKQLDGAILELKLMSVYSTKGGYGGAPDYDKIQATVHALERLKSEVQKGEVKAPEKPKPKIPKKRKARLAKLTHIEKIHLMSACKQFGIDPMEVDNTLTYHENKRHIRELARMKGHSEAEVAGMDTEMKEWGAQYEGYLNHLKGELESAGYQVRSPEV